MGARQHPIDNISKALSAEYREFNRLRDAANDPNDNRLANDWAYGEAAGKLTYNAISLLVGAATGVGAVFKGVAGVGRVLKAVNAARVGKIAPEAMGGMSRAEAALANRAAAAEARVDRRHPSLVANAEVFVAANSRQALAGPSAGWNRHVQAESEIQRLASLKSDVTDRLQAHADFATSSVINDQQVLLSQLSPNRQAQYLRGSMQPALEGKAIEKLWRNSVENDPFLMDYVSLGSKTKGPDFVFTGQLKAFGWGDLTTQRSWMDHVFRSPSLGYQGSGTLIKTR